MSKSKGSINKFLDITVKLAFGSCVREEEYNDIQTIEDVKGFIDTIKRVDDLSWYTQLIIDEEYTINRLNSLISHLEGEKDKLLVYDLIHNYEGLIKENIVKIISRARPHVAFNDEYAELFRYVRDFYKDMLDELE